MDQVYLYQRNFFKFHHYLFIYLLSGDTGAGVLQWIKFLVGEFSSPHIKFYFPTAPLRPYTPLQGEVRRHLLTRVRNYANLL